MEDAKRIKQIKRICGKLRKAWMRHPHEGLGQYLENHVFIADSRFLLADEVLERFLDRLIE